MRKGIWEKWSALIISIVITVIIVMVALYLFDKIIPFSKNTKGIENGNMAYYNAKTAINEALLAMSGSNPSFETGSSVLSNGSGRSYQVTASGKTLPEPWKGSSEYDQNWNRIGPGEPIQLMLPNNISNWGGIAFKFRVPDLNKDGASGDETLSGSSTPFINWILTGSGETLFASGSQINGSDVYKGSEESSSRDIHFTTRAGLTLSGSADTFSSFYTAYCTTSPCTLKLSLINPLLLTDKTPLPYLEYQIGVTGGNPSIPFQSAIIETHGYSQGFRKDITKSVRQQISTNETTDFTIFQ